jgi:mono/diheme cytochrome c family protein
MRKVLTGIGTLVVVALVISLVWIAPVAKPVVAQEGSGTDAGEGQKIFMAQKCNLCHTVSTVGIEAKTTSEKMKGPDLVGISTDAATLAPYLKGESELNGAKHKKKATCSDAELKTLIDWIAAQK